MVKQIVENYVDQLSFAKNDVLKDTGAEVVFTGHDKEDIAEAMFAARDADAEFRAEEGIEVPADEFATFGVWHRAANKVMAEKRIWGGDIAHRVLMASVR